MPEMNWYKPQQWHMWGTPTHLVPYVTNLRKLMY